MTRLTAPILFDRETGLFEHTSGKALVSPPVPDRDGADKPYDRTVAQRGTLHLESVHALQLLCVSRPPSRAYYELNVVRGDGSRVHIIANWDRDRLESEAEELASFLDVSLWRAL